MIHLFKYRIAKLPAKIRSLLTSVIKEGTAKGADFSSNGYIGGKIGTTNSTKDPWFIGLNDNYTAGVWIGKDMPENIEYIGQPHLAIWRTIMRDL